MPRLRDERGIALLLTILSLVVVGALVSGFFMSAMLENRAGQNSRKVEQAFAAAEYGVAETIANWDVVSWNVMPPMGTDSIAGASAAGSGRYDGTVRRLNNEIFLVDITGYSGSGLARQRIGAFVKLRSLMFDIQAALTTRGPGTIGDRVRLRRPQGGRGPVHRRRYVLRLRRRGLGGAEAARQQEAPSGQLPGPRAEAGRRW
jgi:hypothetical protein